MAYHTVERGEWIGSIAAKYGHKYWKPLWDHAKNSALRNRRDPNLLVEGDRVWVPEVQAKEESAPTEARSIYRLEREENKLVIRIREVKDYVDLFGPIPFELKAGANSQKGDIKADDQVLEVPLAIGVTTGTLALAGAAYELQIGALDPISMTSGMQARLINTGWDAGPVDNDVGPLTKAGTRAFQTHYDIGIDGIIGPETRGKMKEVYGC